jgi:hypothetical protein
LGFEVRKGVDIGGTRCRKQTVIPERRRLQIEEQINILAVATGVRYDGWQVTLNVGEEHSLAIGQGRDPSERQT